MEFQSGDRIRAAIGKPRDGLDPQLRDRLCYVLQRAGGIVEAHAPAFRMEGDSDGPRLDMFILVAPEVNADEKVKAIHDELRFQLPPGVTFRIWTPSADEPILAAVRDAGCQVWPSSPREVITVEKETRVQIGRPANPLPTERIAELGRRLSAIPGIEAAFAPMMMGLPGQQRPAQVLVLQVKKRSDRDRISAAVAQAVTAAGVGPMDGLQLQKGDSILRSAEATGCIVPLQPSDAAPTSRWKLWPFRRAT